MFYSFPVPHIYEMENDNNMIVYKDMTFFPWQYLLFF